MAEVRVFYPGYVSKSVTFTIDDGNIKMDKKFLDIVKPYGILGTFNLCSHSMDSMTAEEYREFYRGYEIANHVKEHPFVLADGVNYVVSDEEFDQNTADPKKLYRVTGKPQYYYIKKAAGWRRITDADYYIRMCDEGLSDLEEVFGKDSVRSFVWPYGEQSSKKVLDHLKSQSYYGIRKTGCVDDSTGFAPPADWMAWSYNANHQNLLEVMQKYENFPEDGELKFFSFGVHSVDFERADNWCDLAEFAEKYGNRPSVYWYATVGDIYDYLDAVKHLEITDEAINNPSDVAVFVTVDDVKAVVWPKSALEI